eukprot:1465945-Pyramimonas_sp.AAC.1
MSQSSTREETVIQDAVPDLSDISSIEQIDDAPWTPPTQFLQSPPPTGWGKPPGYDDAVMETDDQPQPPQPPQPPGRPPQIPRQSAVPRSAFPRTDQSQHMGSTLKEDADIHPEARLYIKA